MTGEACNICHQSGNAITINLNQWHNFVGTSSKGTIQIYQDEVLTVARTGTLGTIGSARL